MTKSTFKHLGDRPDLAVLAGAWGMPEDASVDDVLDEEQRRLTAMAAELKKKCATPEEQGLGLRRLRDDGDYQREDEITQPLREPGRMKRPELRPYRPEDARWIK